MNIYTIMKIEVFSERPKVVFASISKTKIDDKLEEIYKVEKEMNNVATYEEGDSLILETDDGYYIDRADEVI